MVKPKSKSSSSAAAGGDAGSDHIKFATGDVVLGKIKGYPPWPGILVDEEHIPKATVLSQRPGKSFLIVRFFPAADYGFNKPHELRRLSKREIEAFLADPHKRNAELRQAYQLAQDPAAWNKEQNDIVREAEEEGDEDDEEEDMLADDGAAEEKEVEEEPPAAKKKRAAPQPKAAPPKKQKTDAAKPAKKAAPPSASSSVPRKSEAAEDHEGEEQELDPETKKVKSWRHALQRGFLNKDGVIKPEEMENHDRILKQVEDYKTITATQLRLTKINKVIKRIIHLVEIPREGEFKIRERAQKLHDFWADVSNGKPREESSATAAPSTNGAASGNGQAHEGAASSASASDSAQKTNGDAATKVEDDAKPTQDTPNGTHEKPAQPPAAESASSSAPAPVQAQEPAQPSAAESVSASAPAPAQAQEPAPTPAEPKTGDLSKPTLGGEQGVSGSMQQATTEAAAPAAST